MEINDKVRHIILQIDINTEAGSDPREKFGFGLRSGSIFNGIRAKKKNRIRTKK